jgi:hypothetical protein
MLMIFLLAELLANMLDNLLGPPSLDNGTHSTEKLLLKTQVSEDFA